MKESTKRISAYIHIPFWYIEMLLREMELSLAQQPIDASPTLYVGGGTPTSLSDKQLDRLLGGINQLFPMETVEEFTLEANPGDLTLDKLQVLKDHGIDRLSMGVQTFDDKLLKKIGRKHTAKDVYDSIALLEKAGFDNVSIDLIYALPGQTLESFRDTLQRALALDL